MRFTVAFLLYDFVNGREGSEEKYSRKVDIFDRQKRSGYFWDREADHNLNLIGFNLKVVSNELIVFLKLKLFKIEYFVKILVVFHIKISVENTEFRLTDKCCIRFCSRIVYKVLSDVTSSVYACLIHGIWFIC